MSSAVVYKSAFSIASFLSFHGLQIPASCSMTVFPAAFNVPQLLFIVSINVHHPRVLNVWADVAVAFAFNSRELYFLELTERVGQHTASRRRLRSWRASSIPTSLLSPVSHKPPVATIVPQIIIDAASTQDMAAILAPPPSPTLSNSTRDDSPSPPSVFSFQSASSASSSQSPFPDAACLPAPSYPENVSYPSGLSFLLEEGHITPLVPSSVSSVSTVYTESFLSEDTPPTPIYAPRKADGSFTRKLSGADFKVLKHLGSGSFGRVFLARDIHTGVSVAIKAMKKSLLREEGMTLEEMCEEQEIMMGLRGQDGQLQLLGSWHDKAYFYLVTEVCLGELTRVVFNTKLVAVYAAEILLALDVLHSQGIIHHDIKTDNILIDQRGHAILADFGLAEKVAAAGGFSTRHCGTVQYLSPEVVRGQRFSYEADIWSFGVMLYVMLMGKLPFDASTDERVVSKILRQNVVFDSAVDSNAQDLVRKLLAKDFSKRTRRIRDIKNHAFFANIDWNALSEEIASPRVFSQTPPTPIEEGLSLPCGTPYKSRSDPHPAYTFTAPLLDVIVPSADSATTSPKKQKTPLVHLVRTLFKRTGKNKSPATTEAGPDVIVEVDAPSSHAKENSMLSSVEEWAPPRTSCPSIPAVDSMVSIMCAPRRECIDVQPAVPCRLGAKLRGWARRLVRPRK